MKLNCRPLTLNLFKPFLKNIIFLQNFWKKKFWPLNLNFHHLVKKIIFPAKFHFKPHWGNFYNMLLFSFKKDLNVKITPPHSNHHIKIPLPAKFSISPMGRYPRASHRCWEHGGEIGGGGKMLLKYLWKSSYVSNIASYKPASLQIY